MRPAAASIRGWICPALLAAALLLGLSAPARAERPLLDPEVLNRSLVPGGIEGACGLALGPGRIYVSDYYHDAVDVFAAGGSFEYRIPFAPPGGPCQLASAPGGALYVNEWHESASRLLPSALELDRSESTGVAVDQAGGNVYVNDRTYVAAYDAAGTALGQIGLGSLGEGYGIAAFAGRLYVPDASDRTVKVYEPAIDPADPVLVIDGSATSQGGFNSLLDAAVAVDPTNGHLIVLDNLQPGFEHPEAALEEFDEDGTFLGQVTTRTVIDGEPSGLAFDGPRLYVTSGNSEDAGVLAFGAYGSASSGLAQPLTPASSELAPLAGPTASTATPAAAPPRVAPKRKKHRRHRHRRGGRRPGGRR